MIVTEEEAKTKRCQEGYAASPGAAREPQTEHAIVNRAVPMMTSYGAGAAMATASTAEPKTAPIYCIGSACMAWTWKRHEFDGSLTDMGYCGKAGRP